MRALLRRFRKYSRSILDKEAGRNECILVERHVDLKNCTLISNVKVGYRSYSNESLLRNVEIGRFCSIGRRCSISAAKHSVDTISTHPSLVPDDFDAAQLTLIGNDVWIGDNVVVLPGLVIGDGSIVGAGAVVTKDVEPYSIVVGIPARPLRMRFSAYTVDRLLEIQWWQFGDAVRHNPGTGIKSVIDFLEETQPPVLEFDFRKYPFRD